MCGTGCFQHSSPTIPRRLQMQIMALSCTCDRSDRCSGHIVGPLEPYCHALVWDIRWQSLGFVFGEFLWYRTYVAGEHSQVNAPTNSSRTVTNTWAVYRRNGFWANRPHYCKKLAMCTETLVHCNWIIPRTTFLNTQLNKSFSHLPLV